MEFFHFMESLKFLRVSVKFPRISVFIALEMKLRVRRIGNLKIQTARISPPVERGTRRKEPSRSFVFMAVRLRFTVRTLTDIPAVLGNVDAPQPCRKIKNRSCESSANEAPCLRGGHWRTMSQG